MAAERSAARDRPDPRPLARALAVFVVVVALAAALATAWAGATSAWRIGCVHHVPPERPLVVRGDSAAVARGRQLATAIANCAACHGEDLGGAVYGDMGPVGMVAGPNLTRGRGGRGGALTDADWDRAVRHGVRRDGTSPIMMPSEVF